MKPNEISAAPYVYDIGREILSALASARFLGWSSFDGMKYYLPPTMKTYELLSNIHGPIKSDKLFESIPVDYLDPLSDIDIFH